MMKVAVFMRHQMLPNECYVAMVSRLNKVLN